MEYLPEKKRTQKTQILKKEAKIQQFRQELVDNNVVLAIVKCRFFHILLYLSLITFVDVTDLVAMRSQGQLPEDPTAHFMDYVGNQRSPLWDDMEAMEDENSQINQDFPGMESEIARLQTQVAEAARRTRVLDCYKSADPEGTNALSTKAMVAKLSGFAKFELDIKLTVDQFATLTMNICSPDGAFNVEKFNEILDVMEKSFADAPAYAGDLENETYKTILQAIRDFNTSEISASK